MTAMGDTRSRAFSGRASDNADASLHLIDDNLEYPPPLHVVESRHLTGDAERGDAIDAGADEEIDDVPETQLIKIAARVKRSGQDRINTFELQLSVLNMRARVPRCHGATEHC